MSSKIQEPTSQTVIPGTSALGTHRRAVLKAAAAAAMLSAGAPLAFAQSAPNALRIGWAISKTGPNAGGVSASISGNYRLWVKEVNDAGGIMLKAFNKRVPIEVVEYDDRSSTEEAVRYTERLISQDKVDFVLAPWGTGNNLAAAPTYEKHGYPLLAVAALPADATALVKRWKHAFFYEGDAIPYAEALLDVLAAKRKEGLIGDTVAMVNIADSFGVEAAKAARVAIKKHGFKLVYDNTYPIGVQDVTPIINEIKSKNADSFIAFSYPPDTFLLTEQAKVQGLNPKAMYLGIGTALPAYAQKFGADLEGVMGLGGVDYGSPVIQSYFKRHKDLMGYEPDRFTAPLVWVSLQMLQQSIERVGKVDRAAVTQELRNGSFETIFGTVKLQNQILRDLFYVGQWQNGEYYGVAPTSKKGAKPIVMPKPVWKKS